MKLYKHSKAALQNEDGSPKALPQKAMNSASTAPNFFQSTLGNNSNSPNKRWMTTDRSSPGKPNINHTLNNNNKIQPEEGS